MLTASPGVLCRLQPARVPVDTNTTTPKVVAEKGQHDLEVERGKQIYKHLEEEHERLLTHARALHAQEEKLKAKRGTVEDQASSCKEIEAFINEVKTRT